MNVCLLNILHFRLYQNRNTETCCYQSNELSSRAIVVSAEEDKKYSEQYRKNSKSDFGSFLHTLGVLQKRLVGGLSVQHPDRQVEISGERDPEEVRNQEIRRGFGYAIKVDDRVHDGAPERDEPKECKAW